MNSRVPSSNEGIDPSVRERAEAAAQRAGMTLNDWLNSTVGPSSTPDHRNPQDARAAAIARETREVADIHQRLDSIARQIEQMSRPAPRKEAVRTEQGVARQLNDAISRLDARLSQISTPLRSPSTEADYKGPDGVERAAAQMYRAPALGPTSLDRAVAEISARQSELDNHAPRQLAAHHAPPTAPVMAPANAPAMTPPKPAPAPAAAPPVSGPDYSSLERHLLKITSQIEALQRPDDAIGQSIIAFRAELADIRHVITEAMPRQAIETIEGEIRALSRRIDENRQSGVDGQALAGVERTLAEIRDVVGSLTPAEQLAGYDEAIRNLGAKLDLILRANDDPGTVQQLENAITALRGIVANVASNDALVRLSEDLRLLSSKVDQVAQTRDNQDSFATLEQRIAALTSALESRERPAGGAENSSQIEDALRGLSERIDRMQVGTDSASAVTHLEQRVVQLLERLEATQDPRSGNMARVEDGLQDILRYLERQQATFAALAESRAQRAAEAPPAENGLLDLVKRELTDIRVSKTEADRLTQDSLEAVHSTLGHVVDRLSTIEGDLRNVRTAPVQPSPPLVPPLDPQMAPHRTPLPEMADARRPEPKPDSYRPELPNPAADQAVNPAPFVAAPREFHAATAPAAGPPTLPLPPKAISDILEPHAAQATRVTAVQPELPPDYPLEPGTRPTGRLASPAERIAASEDAISEIPAAKQEPVSTSSFIAAARRAAQAAAAQPIDPKGKGAEKSKKSKEKAKDKPQERLQEKLQEKLPEKRRNTPGDNPRPVLSVDSGKPTSSIGAKVRSLLVGVSVVVIVLGTFKLAMSLLDNGSTAPPVPAVGSQSESLPQFQSPALPVKPVIPDQGGPSMTSPTPLDRQSYNRAMPSEAETVAMLDIPQDQDPPASDVTGTIPMAANGQRLANVAVPATTRLPDAIGAANLRNAALKGDPTAAYEVAVRFAEGKGVPANLEEAAKWYDRAAQAGLIPAVFRLGTFYEKGLGVKKDADMARRYYVMAADRGNAKAMHNLAVLDADGGGNGANYKSASQWFRKAAERGVADSQFNLAVLYARGIGVEQNLAESYKWFTLAAAQGDADAGRKREDVAKRLDVQSLAAAKLAIQTFTVEPQPEDAINVPTPAGGWDAAPVQTVTKPAAKPGLIKRTAAAAPATH
jgi:localization factor PodJL